MAIRVYPLRMVAYFEAYQFGFFDPLYILNPAKSKNRFASSLEFYFTLFFLIGLVMSFSKKGVIASPVFMILVFHAIFFSILLSLQAPRLKEVSAPFVYLLGSFGVIMSYNFLNKKEER